MSIKKEFWLRIKVNSSSDICIIMEVLFLLILFIVESDAARRVSVSRSSSEC